jgi:hypothetical protein
MRLIDVRHLGRERVIGCWELDGILIAGAAGVAVRRWPELPVYVHERGARHLADPAKLLASAERLYGDQMERLWGEVAPVPEANLHPLSGGEEVLGFRVAYTPGHASHSGRTRSMPYSPGRRTASDAPTFGEDPEAHFELVRERLREQGALARELSAEQFEARIREQAGAHADRETAEALMQAVPPEQQWPGLDRHWAKPREDPWRDDQTTKATSST